MPSTRAMMGCIRKEVHFVPDYKEMYVKLFQSQTQAIGILQEAQKETEGMYMDSDPPDIRLLPFASKDKIIGIDNKAEDADDE